MTTQPQIRRSVPVKPFAVLAVVTIGLAGAITAVRWDRGDSGPTGGTVSTALAPSFSPPPQTAADALAAQMAQNEALTEAQFGPLIRATVPYDAIVAAFAEHENAMAALIGPMPATTSGPTASTASGGIVGESLADAIARHNADFPPLTDPVSTMSDELAAALAQHDASFPPYAPGVDGR